jgi:hypothetical protein
MAERRTDKVDCIGARQLPPGQSVRRSHSEEAARSELALGEKAVHGPLAYCGPGNVEGTEMPRGCEPDSTYSTRAFLRPYAEPVVACNLAISSWTPRLVVCEVRLLA